MEITKKLQNEITKTIALFAMADTIEFKENRVEFVFCGALEYPNTIFPNPPVYITYEDMEMIHRNYSPGSEGAISDARNSACVRRN